MQQFRTHHKVEFKHRVAEEMMMDSKVVKDMSAANAITTVAKDMSAANAITKSVNKFNLPL
jgi:hypothetical protein